MPGEVIRSKATKTHSRHREHKTPKKMPQSSHQEHKPSKQRTLSGYQEDKFVRNDCQKPYWCDGCREAGYGRRYIRLRKNEIVELHKECLSPSPKTSHKCFPGCDFKFLNLKPKPVKGEQEKKPKPVKGEQEKKPKPVKGEQEKKRYCQACGKDVNRFVYHCEAKGWYLHPTCFQLEDKIEISGGVEFQLCCNKVPEKKCLFCKKELLNGVRGNPGWFYVSKTERGSCHFHVYCTREWVIEKWQKIGPEDDKRLALKNMVLAEFNDGSIGRGKKVGKILMIGAEVLKIIVSILLGDPTALIFSVLTKLLLLS